MKSRDNAVRDADEVLTPWMAKLTPDARAAVRRNAADAPPLSRNQRQNLRLLFGGAE